MSSDGSVLVVEDDEAVSHAIQSALEQEGFGVRLAHNCAAGIELAMARMPSLLILDLALPDGSGWSVLESVCGNLRGADVPVIVMSSGTVTRSELRCRGGPGSCRSRSTWPSVLRPSQRSVLAER